MAGNKKQLQFSTEITTEKEWRELVSKKGLVVVDVFSEWAGPCTAMSGPLKILKTSDLGYDWLHLATAQANLLPALHRFANSAEPIFLLLSGGRLIDAIYGCDAPRIVRTITAEVQREIRVSEGLETRATVSLTKLCPAEVTRRAERQATTEDLISDEEHREAAEADRVLRLILSQIAENLPYSTVVVLLPQALRSNLCHEVLTSLREQWAASGFEVSREEQQYITREEVDVMFLERRLPQHDALVDIFEEGPSLVLLVTAKPSETEEVAHEDTELETVLVQGEIEKSIARSIYGLLPGTGSSMEMLGIHNSSTFQLGKESEESVIEVQDEVVGQKTDNRMDDTGEDQDEASDNDETNGYGENAEDDTNVADSLYSAQRVAPGEHGGDGEAKAIPRDAEVEDSLDSAHPTEDEYEEEETIPQAPVRVWNPRELLPAPDSAAARLLLQPQFLDSPVLPGIWTPLTPLSKAAAIKVLFPTMAQHLYTPPSPSPPPPPPTYVFTFNGEKRTAVLEIVREYTDEVRRMGYFTMDRKRLAASEEEYERLVRHGLKTNKTLLVVEVSRVRSAPVLALTTASPVYVSPNAAIAKSDVDQFFGPDVRDVQPEALQNIMQAENLASVETDTKSALHVTESEEQQEEEYGQREQGGEEEEYMDGHIAEQSEGGAGESGDGPGGEGYDFHEIREE